MSKLRYAYYPGCASQEITKEANETTRRVAKALGITLYDMPRANCCGAGLLTDYDRELSLTLNARILAQAEEMELDILTICSTCLMVMRTAEAELRSDRALLERVNSTLGKTGLRYSGGVEVKLLHWVLIEDYGLHALGEKVVRPLDWLRVAPFYGCHSLRPSSALGFDDPQDPASLESVIRCVGAEPVEYSGRTRCCGFQVDLVAEEMALDMTARRLQDAKLMGAHCMVTPCPFCHINLDNYQNMAEKKAGQRLGLPVFHVAQLVGLALGMGAELLGLSRHLVTPEKVLG